MVLPIATILAAQKGNKCALEEIFMGMGNNIKREADKIAILGCEKSDIIGKAYLILMGAIYKFDPKRDINFKWFATCCINKGLKGAVRGANRKIRDPKKEVISLDEIEGECIRFMGQNERAIEEPAIHFLLTASVSDFVKEGLSLREARVIFLRRAGYSYREIGLTLSCKRKSVDNTFQRATGKLRQIIQQF